MSKAKKAAGEITGDTVVYLTDIAGTADLLKDEVARIAGELGLDLSDEANVAERTGEERLFVEVTNEFTWALENLEPEHEYTRFAGSVLEEYLYRSPKNAAEMIYQRMALAAERVFGAADCGNPDPGIL